MSTTDLIEVTITAPDQDWLIDLCRQLIEERLASSAHVIHPITSIYRWDGEVHQAPEARAFLRTRHDLLDDLTQFVLERHPYEVPSITAVQLIGGSPDYLAWVRGETAHRRQAE